MANGTPRPIPIFCFVESPGSLDESTSGAAGIDVDEEEPVEDESDSVAVVDGVPVDSVDSVADEVALEDSEEADVVSDSTGPVVWLGSDD
jgi:hypothetical protein